MKYLGLYGGTCQIGTIIDDLRKRIIAAVDGKGKRRKPYPGDNAVTYYK